MSRNSYTPDITIRGLSHAGESERAADGEKTVKTITGKTVFTIHVVVAAVYLPPPPTHHPRGAFSRIRSTL